MKKWAIIFDVDGVLLELTRDEEELFFDAFAPYLDSTLLSRDWNSYAIRNDEDISHEILVRHGLALDLAQPIKSHYLMALSDKLHTGSMVSQPIAGVQQLVQRFQTEAKLGIATANFREAARLRLAHAGLWHHVSACAFGADGGGAKSDILGRALETMGHPRPHVIFVGDNVNDVEAGIRNKVHFIGFSVDACRREVLTCAGAKYVAKTHDETADIISAIMHK